MPYKSKTLPIRLLITTPNLDTAGMKYVVADIVRGLDRSRVLPSICVHRKTGNALERELGQYVERIIEIPLRISTRPRDQFFRQISKTLRIFPRNYDVVHSFDYSSSWSEGVIVALSGLPWVVEKTNMSWGGVHWFLRSVLAKRIVCLSHAQYLSLFRSSILRRKAITIHTGVDLARFGCAVDRVEARKQSGLPTDGVILGCVAHFVPVKGHMELLRAFSQVLKDYPDTYLALAGEGEASYESSIKQLADELDIAGRVFFLGRRDDVPRLLPAFDGFVLATRDWGRKEAFGAVLVEAMACGLPTIATKSGGPEDIVVPGETGWLVEPYGIEPLVQAMRDMLSDEGRRRRYGAAGLVRAETRFSHQKMVHDYQQLYLEVA